MRFVSWNVNGIRACINKGFNEYFDYMNADIFAIQETKMQEGQQDISKEGYYHYMNSAIKKGYSGTLIYTKVKPISVKYGIDIEEHMGKYIANADLYLEQDLLIDAYDFIKSIPLDFSLGWI